jgi:protoporphyrin/coproporphyrin ferrochelatase
MFATEPSHQHTALAKVGILLVNLGTPSAPTARAVRPYLEQFLSDPRVIEIPRILWWPLLHAVILNVRPRQSARKYAKIWTAAGSPLKVHTERQARLLQRQLEQKIEYPVRVEWAMRYGAPSIRSKIQRLREHGCDRILVIPLYPQYSASATGSSYDAVSEALSNVRNLPGLRIVKHFHDHPAYIHALARQVKDYWAANGRAEKLVMSFHGLPRFHLDRGDPYHCECHKTARLLAVALELDPDQYLVTFQSRFGRQEWLKPYTIEVMQQLGAKRTRRIDVFCPGFVADCLETLEEIAMENKAAFLRAGGINFHYIPCMNEAEPWIQGLAHIALENLHGWVSVKWDAGAAARVAEASQMRARALGAHT